METENNSISTKFSFTKSKEPNESPSIAMCCILGCPITENLKPFPLRYTKEYNVWLKACKESEANIIFKQHPMICGIHFTTDYTPPLRYLTKSTIEMFKHDLDRINHCVAEWILFVRNNIPKTKIDDEALLLKAEEIGKILNLFHFKTEFGWLNIFEKYLQTKNIESWRNRKSDNSEIDIKFEGGEDYGDGDLEEISIKTYEEALERVEVLKVYCKRTKNKSAMEILKRLSKVLQSRC